MMASVAVHASDQLPVRYLVEVRKAGAVVDCPSRDAVLGQKARIPLSVGRTVVALAHPRGADGRSKIVIRVEVSLGEPDGLEFAQEVSNILDPARSSPTFEIRGLPDFHFIVLVESLPLLATTRNEPDWHTHLDKFRPARSSPPGVCQPLLSRRGSVL